MASERELSESFYGTAAGIYDRFATLSPIREWRARAAAELDCSPGDTVVDMGCGTGANLPFLREQVGPEGRVIGVDLVGGMLEQAQARIERNGWKNVSVVQADATRPPIQTVDALVSTFVVGMFDTPGAVVRSWVGMVRPGGRVVLVNASRSDQLLMRPANIPFRLFTRLTAPGHQLRLDSPTRSLERRWNDSVDALFEGTVDHAEARLGRGFVVLASGRVPPRND